MAVETSSWIGRSLAADRYRVTAKLGEGGMGFVFRAWDRNLECDVVIKVPRREMLEDPAFTGRFEREIRSLVRLAHPHIVKVLDVGTSEGLPFAVLQYLSGGSLGNRVNPASLPLVERLKKLRDWLAQVAAALDFMHSEGTIHRDVKPDNILFDARGNVFLSDFGIAKVLADSRPVAKQTVRTQTGIVLGTPQYMAPELIMGQPHDGRVDQYALAIVVYEMLSGALPITGPTPAAILVQQTLQRPVSLDELLLEVPRALAAAVQKALDKDPACRYPDCATFARETLTAAGLPGGRDTRLAGAPEARRPTPDAERPGTPAAERTAETTRVAKTYAEWQTNPKQRAGSPPKKPPAPISSPWADKTEVDAPRERRGSSRAGRAPRRHWIGYLVLACAIGIPFVVVAFTLVFIDLMNPKPPETSATRPVQASVPEVVTNAEAPQPAKIPDVQPNADAGEKWVNAGTSAVPAGDFRVQVGRVRAEGQRLLIRLQIENSGSKQGLRPSPWENDAGGGVPHLTDRRGTNFPWIRSASQDISSLVIEPGKAELLLLVFERPPDDTNALRLELPAEAFGQAGRLRFEIPDNMLFFVTARFRKGTALPGLRAALADADPEMRTAAARALGEIGPDAAVAVRELADRLTDSAPVVRAAAAQALGEIGKSASEARSALLSALGDSDAQVSAAAATALKSLPPPTKADLVDLRQALKAPNPKVRAYVLDALGKMGTDARPALQELVGVLKDNDPALRTAAAGVLGTMGDADEVVSALAELLKDQEVAVRRSAVQSLAGLMPAPSSCVRALIAALDDRDDEVSRQAGAGLKTAQFSKEDVAALANVLRQGQPNGRASAASLFAALGPEAKTAKATLINALEDKDKRVRQQVAKALGNMQADAWDATKKLAALLDDGDRDVRRSAIAALAQIGPDAVVAVPQLIRMLRVAALHDDVSAALVKIGKKAVPGIVEKLSARDNNEKIEACRLLGEMGAEAADAIEALSALAHDRKSELPRVRKAAEEALKKIQR